MATATPDSASQHGELRLADGDPDITHSGSGRDRFNVKFTLTGINLLELQTVLTPRMGGVGVERLHRVGTTMTLYGIEHGREAEVLSAVETAIADVNRARRAGREDAEEAFGDYQLALEALKDRLVEVRDAYAATLEDPAAYERAFERAAARRWPDVEAV